MAPDSSTSPARAAPPRRRLPARILSALGIALAGLALVVVFAFLQFPFERFRDSLAAQVGRAVGGRVTIGSLRPSFAAGAPGFVIGDAHVAWPAGAETRVQRAAVRPAWSSAWLAGTPALHLDARGDLGVLVGTLVLGGQPAFEGRVERLDLARLPLEQLAGGASLYGTADLVADLRLRDAGPVGEARFEARDGSFSAPTLPVAIPFRILRGQVRFAEDGRVELEDVELEGPMLSGHASGGTGPGPSPWRAPLALDVHLEARDRTLRPALRSAGVPLRADGTVDLKLRGSLAAPQVR